MLYSRDTLFAALRSKQLHSAIRNMVFVRKKCKKRLLALFGGVIGLINGFFGGGGGMICVPTIQRLAFLNKKQSHASAIFVIFPISIVSSFVYLYNGYVEVFTLVTVGIGVVTGGIIGAIMLKKLSSKTLQIIFVFVMLLAGVRMIV